MLMPTRLSPLVLSMFKIAVLPALCTWKAVTEDDCLKTVEVFAVVLPNTKEVAFVVPTLRAPVVSIVSELDGPVMERADEPLNVRLPPAVSTPFKVSALKRVLVPAAFKIWNTLVESAFGKMTIGFSITPRSWIPPIWYGVGSVMAPPLKVVLWSWTLSM